MDRDELVELAGERLAGSIFRDAPPAVDGLHNRLCGETNGDEVRIFLYQDVVDEFIYAAAYREDPSFAVLMGAFAVDERGPFVEVTGFSRFQYVPTLETLYRSVRPELDELVDETSGGQDHIVGLFVGECGSGGKLSPEAARTHLSLFNVPYQVVGVVDPAGRAFGLHARRPASSFYNSPFWLVEHRHDSPPSDNRGGESVRGAS